MNTAVASGDVITKKSIGSEIHPTTVALTGIWLAAVAIALFSPDLISGSEHEHIPIGAFTIWFHSGLATAYVLTAAAVRGPVDRDPPSGAGWWTATIWVAVAVAAIFGPEMVTGTDPTRIPIAVLVAPIIGMVTTGFIAIIEAGGSKTS
jgi:predicted MFS family arabinose efflux permease